MRELVGTVEINEDNLSFEWVNDEWAKHKPALELIAKDGRNRMSDGKYDLFVITNSDGKVTSYTMMPTEL